MELQKNYQLSLENKAPKTNKKDLQKMIEALRGRGWQTRHSLRLATGFMARTLRAIANASNAEIISGQKGYKLAEESTEDEIMHCAKRLRHQSKEMNNRAFQIEQRLNRKQ